MQRFVVTGADVETAEDRSVEIEAPDAETAISEARTLGVLGHRAYPLGGRLRAGFRHVVSRMAAWHATLDRKQRIAVDLVVAVLLGWFALVGIAIVTWTYHAQPEPRTVYSSNHDPTYVAERDRPPEPPLPVATTPRWIRVASGDEVQPGIAFCGLHESTRMRPFYTEVTVTPLLMNTGREPQRVYFRLKAINREHEVIHYTPLLMDWVYVVEPTGLVTLAPVEYLLPKELEDDYFWTIIEFEVQ